MNLENHQDHKKEVLKDLYQVENQTDKKQEKKGILKHCMSTI